ncbi:helix-turn-helix transcriptional regulator [Aquibacillus koreensis]|uniref:Helix-turn-helix transcriptional regulator n=1 Tax=Aquibacillus koreensis TaxID=279446 RepID=A0A9X3WRG5_9BACI|nr:helix-turn-helix transcriptional regulator [Aquibacillus koreensis]MCT2536129.1 helix-turn-helix transcriptional regulator [Aquibacillus koreensis]MDC3422054.1 helix-turn-helix transcriptional regulator [Aquibacillus koreensis]
MHLDFGRKIKYFRTKAKMTQDELTQGIISVSYLSKIEKDTADPSPEIISQLCTRLKIKPYNTAEKYTYQLSEEWFSSLLDGDVKKAKTLYRDIEQNIEPIVDAGLIPLVDIHMLHFYILTGATDLADRQMRYLKESPTSFNHLENYYWLKFSGQYYYSIMNYKQSLHCYRKAEQLLYDQLYNPTLEKNDLYYVISVTASKLQMSYLACAYANKALDYYKNVFHLRRSAQCHVILGISYYRAKEYTKAVESYEVAYQLASTLEDKRILSLCNQNLGKLHAELENRDKAIYYYLESYHLRLESTKKNLLSPITSLIAEYYKTGENEKAKKWLEKGKEVAKHLSPSMTYHVYIVEVYKHLINGYGPTFEDLLLKEVLPFFEEKQLLSLKAEYQSILADYYFLRRKYKLAAIYYHQSNKTLEKIYIK